MFFYRDTDLRRLDLLTLNVVMSDDDLIRPVLTYRIESNIQHTQMVEQRLKDILNLLKTSNPVLY